MRLLICLVMALSALVAVAHAQDKSTLLAEIADLKVEAKKANTSMAKVITEIAASKAAGSTKGTNAPRSATASKFKKNPKDGADMIFIPAGEFVMGEVHEVHMVTLGGYYIYRTPVTVAQYLQFCAETGYEKPIAPDFNPNWSKGDHPIVNVSYHDALAYCKWASGNNPGSVRLSTEAEWEKAASWDNAKKLKRKYPWGNVFDRSKLWYRKAGLGDARGTQAVNRKTFISESPYGLSDMAGNVWQWCSDWDYQLRVATGRNDENQNIGATKVRILRGGSWRNEDPYEFNSMRQGRRNSHDRVEHIGFRCVSGQ